MAIPTSIILFDHTTKHLQRLNPTNKTVTPMHEFHDEMKRNVCTSVSIGDSIYVLMKDRSMYRLKYCDSTATWERVADLIDDYGFHPPAVAVSGSIIIAGGSHTKFSKSVTQYDPSLNRWERLTDKQLSTIASANVASQGLVYCLGGSIEGIGIIDRVERLNVVSQAWDEVAPMRKARTEASAVDYCGKNMFVAGGWFSGEKLSSVEKYDPDVNQWTIVEPMLKSRTGVEFRCHLIDGKIWAVGESYKDIIDKYDVETDTWNSFLFPAGKRLRYRESVLARMAE